MEPDFDIHNVKYTEFGVGRDAEPGVSRDIEQAGPYVHVHVNKDVKKTLREMVTTTCALMRSEGLPLRYNPAEKHGANELLHLPLDDEMSASLKDLHHAVNLNLSANALKDLMTAFCYFVRMKDGEGRRLTALRRTTHFKGVLKHRNRLMRLVDNSLQVIDDKVFKLDTDFDMLVDNANIHILRPSSFEAIGKLQDAILAAAPQNIESLQRDIDFVNFDGVAAYAAKHPRAARYLASIQGQPKNFNKAKLKKLCEDTGVEITEENGRIVVDKRNVMGFLQALDRRLYQIDLFTDEPETYFAASRQVLRNRPGGDQ